MVNKCCITVLLLLLMLGLGTPVGQMVSVAQDTEANVMYLPVVMRNTLEPLIAFASNRTGNFEIFLLNPRRMSLRNYTQNDADDMSPGWGPSGLLAWASKQDGNWEIYAGDVFKQNPPRRLTFDAGVDYDPSWSPDGKRIAFTSDRSGNMDIWAMNASDGSGLVRLTTDPTQQRQPAWSPDGRKIAYTSDQEGKSAIYVMNADGANKRKLTDLLPNGQFAAWSPDSEWIIFATELDGEHELFAVNVAQGTLQPATSDADREDNFTAEASWSGDGERVVFRTKRDGNVDLYVVNFDATGLGTGLRRLTTHAADDVQPAWAP